MRSPATTFTVYPGQSLAPAAVGVVGPLTINGSLTLTNANLKFDLGAAASDQMAVTNVVEFDGTNSLLINPLSDFGAGTYPLMTFGTAFVGDPTINVVVGGAMASSRYSFSLDTNTPNTLTLSVTGVGPTNLTWSGDGSGNVWNLNGIANWNVNTEKFFSLDAVTFEDSGSALPAVNLVGSVMPGSVTVSGTKAYTFGGSGKISGFTGLSQQSSGTLTILSTNDFSGLTAIASGSTLRVGNGTTADGALGTGEIQNSGSLIFDPVGSQTIANLISVNNDLTKLGPGRTILSAPNTFNGPVTVMEGTLVAGNATCLGSTSSSAAITNGGALDLNGFGLGDKPLVVSGAGVGGSGAIVNTGEANQEALHNISLAADAVFGGTTRWDLSGHTSTSTEPGLAGNGFNLTKVGGNQISWCCYNSAPAWNTDLGNVDDQGGILSIQCYVNLGRNTGTLIIRSNAAVEFCHNGTTVLDKPISMTNGCIQARYFSSSYPAYSVLSGPITLTGSNVFDVFTTTMTLIVDGQIGGSGMLNKGIGGHTEGGNVSTGVGTLILTASNSFTGDLRVQTGTLVLSNNASVTKAPGIVMASGTLDASKRTDLTLTLASGQTLKGSGTVTGTVASPANTTVSPGVSSTAATLNVSGSVNLSGDTVMDITKTNTTKAADKLAATGAIDLGGTLTVNFSGNTALAAGDRFTLFTATSYTHSFGATNLPSLPGGFAWSNSVVSGAWNIEVIATEPAARPVLTNSFSSSGLTLSWDTAYTSYLLEGETNTVSVGLTTNSADWHPVPGVSGNQVTVPVDPANGSAFFRLRK